MSRFDSLPTPCYVVDKALLRKNLELLAAVAEQSGAVILLAQKAFSMFALYPMIREYLAGTTASGLYEAMLGKETFGGETHVFSPAYTETDFAALLSLADHFVFNSVAQYRKFASRAIRAGKQCGLRLNPECSTQEGHAIYDPCGAHSRLGTTRANFDFDVLEGVSGFHIHTLCEQNSDDLEKTVAALEDKFGAWLGRVEWLNLGGGHHITRPDYDIAKLVRIVKRLRETYGVRVYLEPGEAVVLNTGFLVATVIELVRNDMDIAILDTSAACHMPDVLEMPYRPNIEGAALPGEKLHTFRLGGPTCLAGDIIGDYSFDAPLRIGDRLVFCDMAHYTMVKNNTFNGMPLPAIAVLHEDGTNALIRTFSYADFKARLS